MGFVERDLTFDKMTWRGLTPQICGSVCRGYQLHLFKLSLNLTVVYISFLFCIDRSLCPEIKAENGEKMANLTD